MPIMTKKELNSLEKEYRKVEPEKAQPESIKVEESSNDCDGCKYDINGNKRACVTCVLGGLKENK